MVSIQQKSTRRQNWTTKNKRVGYKKLLIMNTKKILIADFPKDIKERYKRIQDALAECAPTLIPSKLDLHLSITPPFEGITDDTVKQITQDWHKSGAGALTLSLCGIDFFFDEEKKAATYYFGVNAPNGILKRFLLLREMVMEQRPQLPPDHFDFRLHATIGTIQNVENEKMAESYRAKIAHIAAYVPMRNIPIQKIHFMKRKMDAKWETVQTIHAL